MKKAFNSLLPSVFGLVIGFQGVFAQETPLTPKHEYPQDFITQYMEDCREMAIAEGLLPEDAEIVCTCTLDRFQQQYSYEEYQQLPQETKEEVGYDCFDELLYEEEEKK